MAAIDSLNCATATGGLTLTNWIAIGGIAVTILGSLILLIFRSGKVMGKIEHLDIDIHNLKTDISNFKGDIKTDIHSFKADIKTDITNIKGDIENLKGNIQRIDLHISQIDIQVSKISSIEQRLDSLWKSFFSISHSPLQLNDRGLKVLEDSGIKSIVDERFSKIVEAVKTLQPKNAYEVQEYTTKIVEGYAAEDALKDTLQIGAFKSGVDIYTVLFTGSIYIRDRILSELGFDIDDIDKHQPKIS